jgi:uncharacterized protein (DUF427 family)
LAIEADLTAMVPLPSPARIAPPLKGVDQMVEAPKSSGSAPGFAASPGYRVDMEPSPNRIRMKIGDEVIADSSNAFLMLETNHKSLYYFPRADIRMDLLARSDNTSF